MKRTLKASEEIQSVKRRKVSEEIVRLTRRRRVANALRTFLTMDDPEIADETFARLDVRDFERGLEKVVAKLEKWGDPVDRVSERGAELATLMRDTARWHIEHKGECWQTFDAVNGDAKRARSEEHVRATKELFGIVLDRGSEIKMTINDAERVVTSTRRFLDEDTLLEEFDRVTKDLHDIRGTRYGEFDEDQLRGLLRVFRMEGATERWCKRMTFWE